MKNVMTNGFCELNEQEMMGTNGGVVGIIVISATIGFATGMMSTCLANHLRNKETTASDILVGGVKGALTSGIRGISAPDPIPDIA